MEMLLFNRRYLAFLFHLGKWNDPNHPQYEYMFWINGKWREWLKKEGRPSNNRVTSTDHGRFDARLRSIPRPIVFVDENDATDVPELEIGKKYIGWNFDGELVDVYDGEKLVGTYCIERFAPA